MSDNKLLAIFVIGAFSVMGLLIIFYDNKSESEKTKQIYYQYKIDSLKAAQK